MDVNVNAEQNAESLELMPFNVYNTKLSIKEKIIFAIHELTDVIVGLLGVLILLPMTIVIYIAKKITRDEGPIFYKQYRIGKNGKPFQIYKFRTMVVNADEELEKYLRENADIKKEYEEYKKLRNDPRITKLGKFLRKTSLDEIPQLLNILRGEMTLVGPRPYLLKEREDMGNYYQTITSCKPGLTGLWQISGRSEVSFIDRLQMDMAYCYKRSLLLDIKILFKTVLVVLKREGAE